MNTNPFERLDPFPSPPAVLLDYHAERSADAALIRPAPWDIGALPSKLREPLHPWLDRVARWLNTTYAWQPQHVIPPCWDRHDEIPYEVGAVAFARFDAYADAGSTIVWHEQYDRFITRMNKALGPSAEQCRAGKHEQRPARYALAAWPSRQVEPITAGILEENP